MLIHNVFTLTSGTATEVAGPSTQRQVVHLHNMQKSGNNFIYVGSSTVTTSNSIHLDPGESKEMTLEPLDSLFAVSDPTDLELGVLIVRQTQ